jgi:hypothetical protein
MNFNKIVLYAVMIMIIIIIILFLTIFITILLRNIIGNNIINETKPNKILIYLPVFDIVINIILILFTIFLFIYFDIIEEKRPRIIMTMLNIYLVYNLTLLIPVNIINTGLVLKISNIFYTKLKYNVILLFLLLFDILSIFIFLYGFGLFLGITNRITEILQLKCALI